MNPRSKAGALAPFGVRGFRFQWPADLATSWAFEMETLILGWYVLVETGSVLLLTVFGALQFLGTLLSPFFGVWADRLGHRNLLAAMRAMYALLAATLTALSMLDALSPIHVFVITTLAGLVRPSDWAIRNALIGEIMPSGQLMGAMSVSRMTTDSARIAGALAGAGLVALLGMGSAYLGISGLHAVSFLLTLKVTGKDVRARRDEIGTTGDRAASSHWFELREGIAFVRGSPQLMAVMCLAMLVNMTAFPLSGGLLPYAAKEVYGLDRTGLSYLVAGFASGALAASIVLSATGAALRPARLMLTFVTLWYLVLLWFSLNQNVATGLALLVLAGFAHNFCMVPMAVIVLRGTSAAFRGRVMGVRSLAVYGMPVGLLAAGPLIEHFGFAVTGAAYCVVGLLSVAFIALRWRRYLWRVEAMANLR